MNVILLIIVLTIYSCSEREAEDLGHGYRFDYDPVISSDYVILRPNKNTYAITGDVLEYRFDSIYIIAEQQPREVILAHTFNMNYEQEEAFFKNSTLRYYWIINKKNDSIYGPFTKREYLQKRVLLKIPKELEIK